MNKANPPVWESSNISQKTAIFKHFGLNPNDITIYNALFALGRSKTGPIIKETRIASSRVYSSLRHLVTKGLVSYQVKNNIKYYQAELPNVLIEEIEENTKELKKLSAELEHFPIPVNQRNETNVYEGLHGLKMAYEQHVEGIENKEEVSIVVFTGQEFKNSPNLRAFFSNTVDKIMIRKKSKGKMITNKLVADIIKRDRPDSSIYDIRFPSSNYTLPYALNISRKEVMMSVWGDAPIVFTIKNPTIVRAFQKQFDEMWSTAKKK